MVFRVALFALVGMSLALSVLAADKCQVTPRQCCGPNRLMPEPPPRPPPQIQPPPQEVQPPPGDDPETRKLAATTDKSALSGELSAAGTNRQLEYDYDFDYETGREPDFSFICDIRDEPFIQQFCTNDEENCNFPFELTCREELLQQPALCCNHDGYYEDENGDAPRVPSCDPCQEICEYYVCPTMFEFCRSKGPYIFQCTKDESMCCYFDFRIDYYEVLDAAEVSEERQPNVGILEFPLFSCDLGPIFVDRDGGGRRLQAIGAEYVFCPSEDCEEPPEPAPVMAPMNAPNTAPSTPVTVLPPATAAAIITTDSSDDGCFSGETVVQVAGSGAVTMKDLTIGDAVLTKGGTYELVYAWAHVDHLALTSYLQIETAGGGSPLEITGDHMVFVDGRAGPVRADLLVLGDVLIGDDTNPQPLKVSKIKTVNRHGAYAPFTLDGSIVVNGIVASSYASVQGKTSEYVEVAGMKLPITQDAVAHAFASPLRLTCMGMSSRFCDWQNDEGVHVWLGAGQQLVKFMDAQSFPVQALVLILALLVLAPFVMVELTFGATYGPTLLLIGSAFAYFWINSSPILVGHVVNKKKVA